MYLTELFFNSLHDHYDKASVEYAIRKCNEEMLKRIGTFDTVQDTVTLCFGKESKFLEYTPVFQELMEFREMLELFRELIPYEFSTKFKILQVIEESYSIYQYLMNRNLTLELGEQERKNLGQLYHKIEELCRNEEAYPSKKIMFFCEKKEDIVAENTLSLNGFLTDEFSGQKLYVKNRLMMAMKTGGVVVIVFGTEVVEIQKIYGFILLHGRWRECSKVLDLYLMRLLSEEE